MKSVGKQQLTQNEHGAYSNNSAKKAGIKKIVLFILIICLIFFIPFLIIYQRMVNDGSVLADEYCIKVNPLIIARKNDYMEFMDILLSVGSSKDEVLQAENKYMISIKTNFSAEKDWLNKHSAFLNRLDYKILAPSGIKEVARLQHQIHQLNNLTDESLLLLGNYDGPENTELSNKVYQNTVENDKKVRELRGKLDSLKTANKNTFDPRRLFVKIPTSNCPSENLRVPIIPDIFAPKTPTMPNAPTSDFVNMFSLD